MSSPGEEKDYKTTDPVGAAFSANETEIVALDDEKDVVESISSDGVETAEKQPQVEEVKRPVLETQKSFATTTSRLTRTDSNATQQQLNRKPWYKQPNPLRWGAVAPVPKEREVSREYNAGFWSMLTFQWMAPLMHVSIYIYIAT